MTRVAAVDCGTNSVRLLVADVDRARDQLREVHRELRIVRLGQGVDATGQFAPEALDRTFAVMRAYAKLIVEHGAERLRVVATSASRDASNRDDFVRGVAAIFGVEPEVLSGDEEARLSFIGATAELAQAGLPTPYLVVDIGGGSTEFVLGNREVRSARSVDVGCVRLTERHFRDDPPTPQQIADASSDIEAALDQAAQLVPVYQARTLIGLAGTVTTIGGIALRLSEYDAQRIHHSRLSAAQVHDIAARLLTATHEERAAIGVMHPGRVDVIAAGALILDRILRHLRLGEVVVSEHDILDGIALSCAPMDA